MEKIENFENVKEQDNDEDMDTCYKHKVYCPGMCCPKCLEEKNK